ncbi:asparaginyl-tRNA synthetase [Periplaneta americana]|uniref:asparaginyl-tRNA synthetase n=1 Tax=Periplaneta americana TaxID=6978 RepID=UPI0037E7496A
MASWVLRSFLTSNNFRNGVFHIKRRAHINTRIIDVFKLQPFGSHLSIKGWVKAMRKMKDNIFIDVNDGSCSDKLQVLIPKSKRPESLTYGAAIEAAGSLVMNKNGQIELAAEDVTVVGPCIVLDGYPFAPRKSYPSDYLRQYLHLRPRTNIFGALLRVRDRASCAINEHLHNNGYIHIHTPILTSNDCEGAGEVFRVKPDSENMLKEMAKEGLPLDEAYFDSKAFLTVSGQLHLEAVVRGLSKVYTFGPTFRAENSRTRLHLAEFYMIEAEAAFIESLDELVKIMECMIKDVSKQIMEDCTDDVQILHSSDGNEGSIMSVLEKPFQVMTYDQAINILEKHSGNFTSQARTGQGLSKEHELYLVKHAGDCPVFVIDWPHDIKPFYMKQCVHDSSKVSAVDLLVPRVGELCGGSLREDNLSQLQDKLTKLGLHEVLEWYLELRKYGNVPSGGFGMGFERYLQLILGIPNIKDTIPFPRWPHNCKL